MSQTFTYKGRSKVIEKIQKPKKVKPIIDECSFIIISNTHLCGLKTLGSPLLYNYYGETVLSYYIDIIYTICNNPTITVVSSCEPNKIIKEDEITKVQFVENILGNLTNNAEDLKIGLYANKIQNTFILDAHFMPSFSAFQDLMADKTCSTTIYEVNGSTDIGINISDDNMVNFFSYRSDKKLMGAYFFTKSDIELLRKRVYGSSFNKTKFDWEMYSELKIRAIMNNTPSFRIDKFYDKNK